MRDRCSNSQIASALGRYPLIQRIFDLSAARSTPIYLVGGTVRDLLIGRETHDLDFVVQGSGLALARYVADQLGGYFVALDRERSTGRVLLPRPALSESIAGRPQPAPTSLDIASLRGDNLRSDLEGRDFTLNAIAIAPAENKEWRIYDPLDGYTDLERRILRMASPSSLSDDPVRTLRAVRMQMQFSCTIEPQTRERLRMAVPLLNHVSAERVRDEWFKILQLADATPALYEMAQLGLLQEVAPTVAHTESLDHALITVHATELLWASFRNAPNPPNCASELPLAGSLCDLAAHIRQRYTAQICDERTYLAMLKCAALLHHVGVDAAALDERWRLSKREIELLRTAVHHYLDVKTLIERTGLTRRSIYRFFAETGEPGIEAALLFLAHTLATWNLAPRQETWRHLTESVARLLEAWFEHHDTQIRPTLLLSGKDVMRALGQPPGPQIGALMQQLSEEQAAGEILTRQQALAYLQEWRDKERGQKGGGPTT